MRERILITVKTYPTISKKYGELVCTAGLREDGSWVRIYPVPFRRLDDYLQYKKWVWIEIDLKRNEKDPRPETFRPIDLTNIQILDEMKPGDDWGNRKEIVLKKAAVYENLEQIIDLAQKDNALSLAVFRPAKILDFVVEEAERDWDKDTLAILKQESLQGDLFASPEEISKQFEVVRKVPYTFSYRFADDAGKESTMMIEDWEIGQLYWNCLKQCDGNESDAIELVRKKYLDEFTTKKELHLFLGTTRQYHTWASNPFIIIGVFYPPATSQTTLDF